HNLGSIVVFGHSMGACAAFEFVRIAETAGVEVRQLNVSSGIAPSIAAFKEERPRTEQEILNHVAMLEGTSADVFADHDLMKLTLPHLKADYQACDAYSCSEDVKVAAPIHVLGGEQDPYVTLRDLYGWFKHSDDVKITLFEGGHFFLNEHIDD